MMKVNLFSLLCMIVFASCERSRIIYYSYNGVTVTRVDKEGESYFYYGYCDNKKVKCPSSYVFSKYHRGTDIMVGYIVFKTDSTVDIVNGENIQITGKISSLKLIDFDNAMHSIKWHDSIKNNYQSTIYISHNIRQEQHLNKKNNSKVEAIYW